MTTSSSDSSQLRYDGKVIVVTGAGGGMGREHARLLASRGARVVVNDVGAVTDKGGGESSSAPAEAVVAEIKAAGGEAIANADTVATEAGAKAIIDAAYQTWGRVDGVLHNAAITRNAPIEETNFDDYRAVMAVSLDGALYLTKAVWPIMQRQRYGRLVYVTSGGGLVGVPRNTIYAIAKTGLLGLMNIGRIEGAEYNIGVNLLGVAAFTRMTKGMFGDDAEAKRIEAWWERYLRPEMTSPVAAWLLHEQCKASGTILNAAGGHVSRSFLAETRGYTNLELSIENIRDNVAVIDDEANYHVMRSGEQINRLLSVDLPSAGADDLGHAGTIGLR